MAQSYFVRIYTNKIVWKTWYFAFFVRCDLPRWAIVLKLQISSCFGAKWGVWTGCVVWLVFDEAFVPAVAAISGSKSMADISSFKESVLLGSAARDQCFAGQQFAVLPMFWLPEVYNAASKYIEVICWRSFWYGLLLSVYLSGHRSIRFAKSQRGMSLNVCLCMFASSSVWLQMWHVGLSCDGWRMPFQSTCQFVAHCVCSPVFPLFFSLFFPSCFPHPLLSILFYSAHSASARAL